jgi:hypothetical protein
MSTSRATIAHHQRRKQKPHEKQLHISCANCQWTRVDPVEASLCCTRCRCSSALFAEDANSSLHRPKTSCTYSLETFDILDTLNLFDNLLDNLDTLDILDALALPYCIHKP